MRFAPGGSNFNGAWGRGSGSLFGPPSPRFDDHIGTGGAGDFWTYQTFSATDYNNPVRALAVIE